MKVVGIDPAPGRGGYIFDGTPRGLSTVELSKELEVLRNSGSTLLCWDAPLTGPPSPVELTGRRGELTKRPIEEFFTQVQWGFRVPPGISVQGYGACPHWTISRHLLGLPRVSPWDSESSALPFRLVTDRPPKGEGPYIVEVHPAVAIWLWCGTGDNPWSGCWKYKKDPSILFELWSRFSAIMDRKAPRLKHVLTRLGVPKTHDDFDARVAWALGRLWLRQEGSVECLGSPALGSFLLPVSNQLSREFRRFEKAYQSKTILERGSV